MTAIFRITDGVSRTAGTNKVINPSLETNATGYVISGTNTIARSTAQSKFGAHSLQCTYAGGAPNVSLSNYAITLTAEAHEYSVWVYIPSNWDGGAISLTMVAFAGIAINRPTVTTAVADTWTKLTMNVTPDAGDLTGTLRVITGGAPTVGRFIFIDGMQCLASTYEVDYIDGDQQFCTWDGTPHASTSTKSAFTATSVQFVGDNRRDGLYLKEIRPQAAAYKDGGTYASSPLADGRRLVDTKYENVIETLELVARNIDQDSYAEMMQNARNLLTKAANYWTTRWATEPVWIEAKGLNETNMRYALVMNGAVPEDDNPWGMPFINPTGIISKEISLVIERLHWMSNPPRIGTPTQISAVEPYIACCDAVPEASADDATLNITTSALAVASVDGVIGQDIGGDDRGYVVRFKDVPVLAGATIESAYIDVYSLSNLSPTTVDVRIYGEDSSEPAAFSTWADYTARPTVSSTVDWDNIGTWVAGTLYTTPDITTIIQDIIDRSDWVNGNNLAIFILDNGATAQRSITPFDSGSYPVPLLRICYSE